MSNNENGRPSPSILDSLFQAIPSLGPHFDPRSKMHILLKQVARQEVARLFSGERPEPRAFGPFGELVFPYHKMGAISSLNLFDLDELIIFSFYWTNRKRYRRVLDIGANLGLHSIILSRCGYEVRSFEPEPHHFEILEDNLALNGCRNVKATNAAVSAEAGQLEFVRVLGNTTASHLSGSKPHPYGELERFPVKVEAIGPLAEWADLLKIDVEGHETRILLATTRDQWSHRDALLEIENGANAATVFEHFTSLGVKLFAQKINWRQVQSVQDMPTSYREGTLFATCRAEMPWS